MLDRPVLVATEGVPKRKRSHEAIASAVSDLEYEVYAVRKMSDILRDMMDFEFAASMPSDSAPEDDATMSAEQRENLHFLVAELNMRAGRLDKAFLAALQGEKPQ